MASPIRRRAVIAAGVAILLSLSAPARSALRVVPDQYATIQAAFAAASAGDSIMVRAGIYVEALALAGKDVTLFGESGSEATSITTNSAGRVLTIGAGVTSQMVLSDLTIRNGLANDGAGIFLTGGASPVLRRCRLIENWAYRDEGSTWGGAIRVETGSTLLIEDCVFEWNRADYVCCLVPGQGYGGAVSAASGSAIRVLRSVFTDNIAMGFEGGFGGAISIEPGASASIEDCSFRGNGGYGGGVGSNGDLTIERCVFAEHDGYSGAAVLAYGGHTIIRASLFFDNFNWGEAAVVYIIYPDAPGEFSGNTIAFNSGNGLWVLGDVVRNNIIAANQGSGLGGYSQPPGGISCNDIWGNTPNYEGADLTGTYGNISLDPLFCDAAARDLRLRSDSPCAPGAGDCGLIGALDVGCTAAVATENPAIAAPRLLAVQPNPVLLPPARIAFELPAPARVRLVIHDAMGRLTARLADQAFAAGRHEILWRISGPDGRSFSAGVYFVTFEAGAVRQTQRLILIR